jgi:hypothetical protein
MASAAADFVAGREVRLGDLYDEAATLIVGYVVRCDICPALCVFSTPGSCR